MDADANTEVDEPQGVVIGNLEEVVMAIPARNSIAMVLRDGTSTRIRVKMPDADERDGEFLLVMHHGDNETVLAGGSEDEIHEILLDIKNQVARSLDRRNRPDAPVPAPQAASIAPAAAEAPRPPLQPTPTAMSERPQIEQFFLAEPTLEPGASAADDDLVGPEVDESTATPRRSLLDSLNPKSWFTRAAVPEGAPEDFLADPTTDDSLGQDGSTSPADDLPVDGGLESAAGELFPGVAADETSIDPTDTGDTPDPESRFTRHLAYAGIAVLLLSGVAGMAEFGPSLLDAEFGPSLLDAGSNLFVEHGTRTARLEGPIVTNPPTKAVVASATAQNDYAAELDALKAIQKHIENHEPVPKELFDKLRPETRQQIPSSLFGPDPALDLTPKQYASAATDTYGIPNVPDHNSWAENNGLILIPLPGGGDIKHPADLALFGIQQ